MLNIKLLNFKKLRSSGLWLALIIAFYLFNGVNYLRSQSITSDEGAFYNYAIRYVQHHPDRINPINDNSKMPVISLNVIPRAVQQVLHPGLKKTDNGDSDIVAGRYVTLLISVFIILFVFLWAKELYGINAGIFAAFLASFCPNNLANAALVTTDSYSVLCLLITMYYLWRFCKQPSFKIFLLLTLSIAVSQLVKQSLFHLYVIVPLILIVNQINRHKPFKMKIFLRYFLVFILINWLVINGGYYFYHTNETLGNYHFMSNLFQHVQQIFPGRLPLPFPKPFVEGLDMTKYYDQLGGGYDNISSFGKVTILDHSSTGGSFWYYYFVSLFYKSPITYLILFFASVFLLFRTTTFKNFLQDEFFLLVPVLYFLFIFSFFYKTQCGIRHIIFIFPLLFIFSSRVILFTNTATKKIIVTALSIYLVVSVSFYWKNYYPYTNEFISDKKMAYAYVGAGNLEFLQGNYFFKQYLSKHPEVKMAPPKPQTGIFLINSEDYLDIWNRHTYDWLSHIKPCGEVAYNGLLIKVEEKDLASERN